MKLKITKIEKGKYTLVGKDKKEYEFCMTFQDTPFQPQVGDSLEINDKFLNPNFLEYSPEYVFGDLASIYGREIRDDDDTDFVILTMKRKKFYLKRLFG